MGRGHVPVVCAVAAVQPLDARWRRRSGQRSDGWRVGVGGGGSMTLSGGGGSVGIVVEVDRMRGGRLRERQKRVVAENEIRAVNLLFFSEGVGGM